MTENVTVPTNVLANVHIVSLLSLGVFLTIIGGGPQLALVVILAGAVSRSIYQLYQKENDRDDVGYSFVANFVIMSLSLLCCLPYFLMGFFWINLVVLVIVFALLQYFLLKSDNV